MARPLRLEYAGALYHVTSRGDRREDIYIDDDFVNKMQCKILPDKDLSEIPLPQKRQVAKSLTYYAKKYKERDTAIYKSYESGSYSMKEIRDYYNLHYSRVSRIVKANNKT